MPKPHTISDTRRREVEMLGRSFSLGEIAMLMDISQVTIRKLVRDRIMPQERDGSYVLSRCLRVWIKYQLGTYEYLEYFPSRLRSIDA